LADKILHKALHRKALGALTAHIIVACGVTATTCSGFGMFICLVCGLIF